jgi:hypothetical protein
MVEQGGLNDNAFSFSQQIQREDELLEGKQLWHTENMSR